VLARCGRVAAIALELAAALGFWQIVELGDHVESP
jgi:hypothetical protein